MTLGGEKELGTQSAAQEHPDQIPTTQSNAEIVTPSSNKAEDGTTNRDIETRSVPEASQPPNGGLEAWLRVLAGFFVFFNTWGLTSTYGAFQAYYQSELLSSSSSSAISWIGSIQSFLVVVIGIVAGPLFDKGYLRPLMFLGCFLEVFGMMMVSLAETYYQVFLAQALVVGLGAGLTYIPALALISTQFTTKRPIAIGCASAGSSIGGIIFPIIFRKLQPQVGFGWAVRTLAFLILGLSILVLVILGRHRGSPPKAKRVLVDLRAFRELPFALFSAALFFIFLAFYIPLFYITSYAQIKLHTSNDFAFYLLSITNAGSFFGRTLPFIMSQRFKPTYTFMFWTVAAVIVLFAWIAIDNVPGFVVFCVVWGFISGVLNTAPASVLAHPTLAPSSSVMGTRLGMSWSVAGLGILVGTPIAGALVDINTAHFLPAQIWGGAVMAAGALCLLCPLAAFWRYSPPKSSDS